MEISSAYSERIRVALAQMVENGLLDTEGARRAQECASKMFRLIGEYQEPGLVALGMVGGLIDELINL